MAKTSYFNDQFRTLLSAIGYLGVLPFYLFLLMSWFGESFFADFGGRFYDPVWLFRFFSISLLAFMSGALWSISFSLNPQGESFEFKPL